MNVKRIFGVLMALALAVAVDAQIGYQVALLNTATGAPRANVEVAVKVKLAGSDGSTILETEETAMTNDLGLISLTIGDADTFANVDWVKALPLFVSVWADDVLVANSQVLNVPVAEYSKKTGFVLTKEFLCSKTWIYGKNDPSRMTFKEDGTCFIEYSGYYENYSFNGFYYIEGDKVFIQGRKYWRDELDYETTLVGIYSLALNDLLLIRSDYHN